MPPLQNRIRVLPYPDGKTFAFTIIDDTDGATLETVRPVYEFLSSLGLRTTKTVWMIGTVSGMMGADAGDSLERKPYAEFIMQLRQDGFEIALHDVASASSMRPLIEEGLERFRELFADYPKINVHHEKNRENLYFSFACDNSHLPSPFRTAFFQTIHRMLRHNGTAPPDRGCCGENPESPYFWGDLCSARIKYVRTNLFFHDLNTLKCNPSIPYRSEQTPCVSYWFDSSNGQDAESLNAILSDRNIARLRAERGCAILYTHFGRGFLDERTHDLNLETKRRLRAVARLPDGWFAPAGDLLDRLLAFQSVSALACQGGIALWNRGPAAIPSVTVLAKPGAVYCGVDGGLFRADEYGRIVLPALPPAQLTALLPPAAAGRGARWFDDRLSPWLQDLEQAARLVKQRWGFDA